MSTKIDGVASTTTASNNIVLEYFVDCWVTSRVTIGTFTPWREILL